MSLESLFNWFVLRLTSFCCTKQSFGRDTSEEVIGIKNLRNFAASDFFYLSSTNLRLVFSKKDLKLKYHLKLSWPIFTKTPSWASFMGSSCPRPPNVYSTKVWLLFEGPVLSLHLQKCLDKLFNILPFLLLCYLCIKSHWLVPKPTRDVYNSLIKKL